MRSIIEEWIQRDDQNPDGSMKPEYRQRLQSKGFSEHQIAQMEERGMLNVKTDLEVAVSQREYEKNLQEWEDGEGARIRQQVQHLPKAYEHHATPVNMLMSQTRAEKMSGLDPEELLSQGFLEPDDFYDPEDEADKEAYNVHERPAYEPPDIPF